MQGTELIFSIKAFLDQIVEESVLQHFEPSCKSQLMKSKATWL